MIAFDPTLAARLARGTDKQVRERAFRLRAGLQGAMASCLRAWPIVKHPTSSEHDERCPAHAIIESSKRAAVLR